MLARFGIMGLCLLKIITKIKNETIIEVDTTRIDVDNDLSFKELKYDRNRLYMLLFIRNTSIVIAIMILLIILSVFAR